MTQPKPSPGFASFQLDAHRCGELCARTSPANWPAIVLARLRYARVLQLEYEHSNAFAVPIDWGGRGCNFSPFNYFNSFWVTGGDSFGDSASLIFH